MPATALIDLAAVRHNYHLASSLAPRSKNMAIVKADAYGHGAVQVAQALETLVPAFGVAFLAEAQQLREAGIVQPILLLQGASSVEDVILASKQNYWLVVQNLDQVDMVCRAPISTPVKVWLKADTGLHRLGLQAREYAHAYSRLKQSRTVEREIVQMTHLACADDVESPFTHEQLRRFAQICECYDDPLSIANSPGLMGWEATHSDWNRPGYMLYGASPFSAFHARAARLKPVMTLTARVLSVRVIEAGEAVGYSSRWVAPRRSRIATVGIGYGDGYPRQASNGTPVLINGQRAPLAGRVSMDMITVDVTDVEGVRIGDLAQLWGDALPVNEVAAHAGTNGYELLTRLKQRVQRRFILNL